MLFINIENTNERFLVHTDSLDIPTVWTYTQTKREIEIIYIDPKNEPEKSHISFNFLDIGFSKLTFRMFFFFYNV